MSRIHARSLVVRTTIALAALAPVLGLSGCLLLSPDSDDPGLLLRMRAQGETTLERAARVAPIDLLGPESDDQLVGYAIVTGEFEDETLFRQRVPLEVGPFEDGGRDLSGSFDLERGPVGTEYLVTANLDYRPATVAAADIDDGIWGGALILDAGDFEFDIRRLELNATGIDPGSGDALFTGTIEIVSDLLDTFGSSETLTFPEFALDTSQACLTGVYDSQVEGEIVDLLDDVPDEREKIEVVFDACFVPVTIYSNVVTPLDRPDRLALSPGDQEASQDLQLRAVPEDIDPTTRMRATIEIRHSVLRGTTWVVQETASAKLELTRGPGIR